MQYQKLSTRQNLAMTWWNRPGFEDYEGIICDGSIRSGKTVAMTVGFIMWAMSNFSGQNFALCGKTIESLRRNVTSNLPAWLCGVFTFKEHRTENKIVVRAGNKTNSFYLFGGKDESSQDLIQGITLAGILLDEVALMPESFVNQATGRCSVEGSKLWFNCNPAGPSHWFYTKWVQEAKKRKLLHLHFTMDDNLSLSPAVKARYESLYSGVFYDRFIRGLWVVAEGLIYTMFNKDFHVVETVARPYDKYMISCDYGTVNPTSIRWYAVTVYEAVVLRLAMLGYEVTDNDKTGLEYLINKCEKDILANINQKVLPDGLFYTLVDMVVGHFMYNKKAAGALEGFDFEAPAKSITEGDISVTFAGASDGAQSAEARFDALLATLMHPAESTLAAYRRMRW